MATILFNKPYGVLSQFTPTMRYRALADFGLPKHVYPAGRLDAESEGLLLLTSDGRLNAKITQPRYKREKIYWAQIERIITNAKLKQLESGIILNDGPTLPCRTALIPPPELPKRIPPIRERKTVPVCWVEIALKEGRNRQVRRMLAAMGFPVLRLVRYAIGKFTINGLLPGKWRMLSAEEIEEL